MDDPQALSARAWQAWRCLPRDRGQPPSIRRLEHDHGISNAQLNKLINGISKRPSFGELAKMAKALQTTPEWLQYGTGGGPIMHQAPEPWPGPRLPKKRPRKTASTARSTGT